MILIIDLGSQYTQLIAKQVRQHNVYCEIEPFHKITTEFIKALKPEGIILSGGPSSVYKHEIILPEGIFYLEIPILGICYGMQLGCEILGGKVVRGDKAEYGTATLKVIEEELLFIDVPKNIKVWMSHKDQVTLNDSFEPLAQTENCRNAAVRHQFEPFYGIQFHPEVKHTEYGHKIICNFLKNICNATQDWTAESFIDSAIQEIKNKVGNKKVVLGLSGGVDSSVVAVLLEKAIGKNLSCIYVDTGLMRENETELIKKTFTEIFPIDLHVIHAENEFLSKLKEITDPEEKRTIVGHEFVRLFEIEAEKVGAKFLAQGTIYPDIIESIPAHGGPTAQIKKHHNVGGLPGFMKLELIEPLKHLFKNEVRSIGLQLKLPDEIVWRHPYPGPGLAIRIIGAITKEKCNLVRSVDKIIEEVLKENQWYNKVWQAFPVLLPVQTVGVMGDERTYEFMVSIRIVNSVDAMTANWAKIPHDILEEISTRVVNEVRSINRVLYDITNKPPSTIEYE